MMNENSTGFIELRTVSHRSTSTDVMDRRLSWQTRNTVWHNLREY
jgi:hypothetical protein